MEQANIDAAVKKLKIKNTKEVWLTKVFFQQLANHAATALNGLGAFRPSRQDPNELRKVYDGIYAWLSTQMSDIYKFPIQKELLSHLKLKDVDFREGLISIEVKHEHERVMRTFTLSFRDETAPYSTVWVGHLDKVAGNNIASHQFKKQMEFV